MIAPGHELSRSVHSSLEVMKASGTIVVVMKIVLARPEQFHGNADLLGDGPCFEHVIIREAAAEATSGALHVHNNVIVGNAEHLGALHAAALGSLARRPEFEFAVVVMCEAILRLHGSVREERIGISRFN